MTPSLRNAIPFFLSMICGSVVAAPVPPDAPDLVVLAQPAPSDALGTEVQEVSLPYDILEVFEGEPPGASIVVRHRGLDAEGRARLRDGERVIVLARRDPDAPGRFVAPVPLRATPTALAAFRRWSAPEDVRSARSGSTPAGAASPQDAPAASRPAARRAAVAPAAKSHAAASREPAAQPPVAAMRAAVAAPAPAGHAGPPRGPGLPPVPSGTLGPPLADRLDLEAPRRGGRRR